MPWNLVINLRNYWHWYPWICKVTSQRPIGLGYRKLQYPEWDKDNAKFHCFELKWYDFNKCTVIIWLYINGHLALEGMGEQLWYSPTFWIMTWSVTVTCLNGTEILGMKCSDCMMPFYRKSGLWLWNRLRISGCFFFVLLNLEFHLLHIPAKFCFLRLVWCWLQVSLIITEV